MHKNLFSVGVGAFAAVLLFSGCGTQNIEQGAKEKLMETLVNNASEGKVNLDMNGKDIYVKTGDGEVKISNDGQKSVVKTGDGEAVFDSGSTRPASVPDDFPNLTNAKDFSWVGSSEGGMLSYLLNGVAYVEMCDSQMELLTAKGWIKDNSFTVDFENTVNRKMDKQGYTLSVSCSITSGGDDTTTIVLVKSKA